MIIGLVALNVDENFYSAFAAGIQAAVVIPALAVAALTWLRDSHDRRVDRVYALHQELTTGEVGEARPRLGHFLRSEGIKTLVSVDDSWLNAPTDPVRRVSSGQLRRELAHYPVGTAEQDTWPRRDLTMVLRFFERANAARQGNAVDEVTFCALIGRHAVWWDIAIAYTDTTARRPLRELADWANSFEEHRRSWKLPGLENWGTSREKDFPSLYDGHVFKEKWDLADWRAARSGPEVGG